VPPAATAPKKYERNVNAGLSYNVSLQRTAADITNESPPLLLRAGRETWEPYPLVGRLQGCRARDAAQSFLAARAECFPAWSKPALNLCSREEALYLLEDGSCSALAPACRPTPAHNEKRGRKRGRDGTSGPAPGCSAATPRASTTTRKFPRNQQSQSGLLGSTPSPKSSGQLAAKSSRPVPSEPGLSCIGSCGLQLRSITEPSAHPSDNMHESWERGASSLWVDQAASRSII
jgi:hypothetical protein